MKPIVLFVVVFTSLAVAERSWGQNANLRRLQQQQKEMQRRMEQQMRDAAAAQPDLPSDPDLLLLHKEFITRAEKLAAEYERKKQYDKAREVFEAMTRLLPKYQEAQAGLQRMLKAQSMQDRKLTEVQAAAGWQDSGATLIKGMPVRVDVKGSWSVVVETGPEGVQIPNDLKPRDSKIQLGSLIGVIAGSAAELEKAQPFLIKSGDEFVAKENGRLFFRMFDIDPSDNQGKLYVLIQSTFGK